MCKGGSGNTTTTSSSPPASVMAQYNKVQGQANSVANNPYFFYPGQQIAGMSGNQTDAIGNTANIAGALANPANSYGMAQPFINAGSSMTGQAANTIGGVGNSLAALENPANTYGQAMPFINQASGLISSATQPIRSQQINNYMNPYLQQVGATTSAEMNQNNAIQQQGLLGNAAASGALGGNRVGLAQSALANQQNMAENATLANINSQGFNTALGAAQTTAGQQLQGGFLAGQTGQMAENAALTGLTAPIGAAQSIAGTQLAAGSQYGNLGTANESAALSGLQGGLTGAAAQYGMGTAQQQQQQNELSAAQGQWTGSVQYPYQNTNFLSGISSGLGSLMGGNSSTTAPGPSTGSQVLGGLTSAASIAAMFMKSGGRTPYAGGGTIGDPYSSVGSSIAVPNETGAGSVNPEIGAVMGMTSGPGVPNAPQVSPTANASNAVGGFSSMPELTKAIGALKPLAGDVSGTSAAASAGYMKSGGAVSGFAYGGASVPTPMSEQILDYQMMGQLMPGSQIQKTTYPAPQGMYAAGGAVHPTMPEAPADVHAQIAALADPKSARRAVFLAKGTPLPKSLPPGIEAAQRPEGTLFSADKRLLQHFHDAPQITDEGMAEVLGYLHGKAHAGPHPAVVRAHDGHGVSYESAVHPDAIQAALMLARAHAPGAHLDVVDPRQALHDRADRRGYATGGAPQGMQGVSSLPLVGAQAGLSAPNAGQIMPGGYSAGPAPQATALSIPGGTPSTAPVVGAPQSGGIVMPNVSNSNQFAPVTLPGGATTGPITNANGIPDNYFSAIEQASPYFNPTSSATAPSSGLHPYQPPAAAKSPLGSALTAALNKPDPFAYMNVGAGMGAKTGGRIGKDVGGSAGMTVPIVPTDAQIAAMPSGNAPPVVPMAGIAATPLPPPSGGFSAPASSAATPATAPVPAASSAPSAAQPPVPGGVNPNAWYGNLAGKIDTAESGNNPTAANPRSTAYGPGQFTDSTWLDVIKTAAPEIAAKSTPQQLLALRSDPEVSKQMTTAYAKQNATQLAANGIPVSYTNLDLAHRFGATGATRIISAPGTTPAVDVLGPLAIKENPQYAHMTTAQLIAQSGVSMGATANQPQVADNGVSDVSNPGFGRAPSTAPGSIASPQIGPPSMQSVQQSVGPVPKIPQAHETTIEKLANSPWMALANAGFGMMAGTSPFFGVNVGRGMEAGTQYLINEQAQQRANQTTQANTAVNQANATIDNRKLATDRYWNEAAAQNTAGQIAGTQALDEPNAAKTAIGNSLITGAPPAMPTLPQFPGAPNPNVPIANPNTTGAPVAGAAGQSGAATPAPNLQTMATTLTGLPPATAPNVSNMVVGPNGQQMPYPQAYQLASRYASAGIQRGSQWLQSNGIEASAPAVNALVQQSDAASQQDQTLNELKAVGGQFLTGAGAPGRADLLKVASTIATAFNEPLPSDLSTAATAAQIIPKASSLINATLARAAGDQGGHMILQDVAPAVPGMLNTRQGLDKLVTLYSTLNARTQSKAAFIRGVVQQGQMNYDQATQAFNQMYPAQMWTSHVDPLKYNGNPAQLKPGYGYTVGGATGIWNGQTFVPVGGN